MIFWGSEVAALLDGDAIEHRPSEKRPEQQHAAGVAICEQMRERPDFDRHQHGVTQPALILPGAGFMQASATKANHIRGMVRWRVHVGGVQTWINPSAR